jgi:hypothetical protein
VLLRKCCSYKRTILSTRRCLAASFASSVLEIKFAYGPAERKAVLTNLLLRVRGAGILRVARRAQSNPEQTVSLSVDLIKFGLLFSTLYAAFGVASPFLPELLSLHGVWGSRYRSPRRFGCSPHHSQVASPIATMHCASSWRPAQRWGQQPHLVSCPRSDFRPCCWLYSCKPRCLLRQPFSRTLWLCGQRPQTRRSPSDLSMDG